MGCISKEHWSILIVDDQLGVRRLLYEALKDEYEKVYVAGSGMEAIDQVQEHNPDLIVMDMKMPRMNGLEVLKHLRQIEYYCPVIMMTAYGELEIVAQATQMGVRDYITKPFDLKELKQLISNTLKEQRNKTKNNIKNKVNSCCD